jgi:hypothetical protein
MADARGGVAGDEPVDLGEGDRAQSGVAMVDLAEQDIGRALERRSVGGHVERHARLVEENPAVGLRVEIEAVAAQRQERNPRRHFRVASIELRKKRTSPVVFAARRKVGRPDAVVRRTPKHRMSDAPGVGGDIFARRVATARRRDDRDLGRASLGLDAVDERRQFAQLVCSRRAVGLGDSIVVASLRIGETDREQPVAWIAIALEPPDLGFPGGGEIAVAMHEHDWNRRFILREGGSPEASECEGGGPLKQATAIQHRRFSPCLNTVGRSALRGAYTTKRARQCEDWFGGGERWCAQKNKAAE